MTSPFQTDLRDRAAAHAREWEAARDPSVGLEEVTATVRRRRRGRGVLVGAASVVGVALVAGGVYVGASGGVGEVLGGWSGGSVAALEALGPDAVVLTVDEELPNPGPFNPSYDVLVVDGGGKARISYAQLTEALGPGADDWPIVTLVAVEPRLSRALFVLESTSPDVATRVAILNASSGDVVVVDPCASTLSSIDLSPWCLSAADPGGGVVIDPDTGRALSLPAYEACSGAAARFDGMVVATCGRVGYESYLVTVDPTTGEVVDETALGDSPIQAPLVAGGTVYVNRLLHSGGEAMVGLDGESPSVGGASATGLGVVGDRVLVQTSADPDGDPSTYGMSIGLWTPSTGDFTKLFALSDAEAWSVQLVEVLR